MLKDFEKLNVRIFSIDIGARTQDILLYNDSYQNAFKLILPSPTLILANIVRKYTEKGTNILVTGETMGGGAFNHALYHHLSKGLDIYMSERAAFSVRDDLEVVKKKGIQVINDDEVKEIKENGIPEIETKDINKVALDSIFNNLAIEFKPEIIAIGAEDHGVAKKGQNDRVCRFEHFKEFIPGDIKKFGYVNPPDYYSRMMGVKRTLESDFPDVKHIIMDSKIAAIFGSIHASGLEKGIIADIGNGHTTVASFENGMITGLFEHHTNGLTREKLEYFINNFGKGDLTNKEVFDDGGHGCFISEPIGDVKILATGPQRNILLKSDFSITFLDPYGDTMITGNVGLTECAKLRINGRVP